MQNDDCPLPTALMLTRIRHLLELIRFSHTIFALPFALLAALMAWRMNYSDDRLYVCLDRSRIEIRHDTPVSSDEMPETTAARAGFFHTSPWRWQDLVGILLCMITGRSAAMAFNRLADRNID